LGTKVETIRRFIADDPELVVSFEQAIAKGPGGANNPAGKNQHTEEEEVNVLNTNIDQASEPSKGGSDDKGYAIRRLAKDRPDLLEEVKSGAMTAHGAMVAGAIANLRHGERGEGKKKLVKSNELFFCGRSADLRARSRPNEPTSRAGG
jgi:hypothetical protein